MSDGFEAIARRFRDRCANDLVTVETALSQSPNPGSDDLRTVVHRLAGLAATFGFAELGRLSREIDLELVEGRQPSQRQLQALAAAMAEVAKPS